VYDCAVERFQCVNEKEYKGSAGFNFVKSMTFTYSDGSTESIG